MLQSLLLTSEHLKGMYTKADKHEFEDVVGSYFVFVRETQKQTSNDMMAMPVLEQLRFVKPNRK